MYFFSDANYTIQYEVIEQLILWWINNEQCFHTHLEKNMNGLPAININTFHDFFLFFNKKYFFCKKLQF